MVDTPTLPQPKNIETPKIYFCRQQWSFKAQIITDPVQNSDRNISETEILS